MSYLATDLLSPMWDLVIQPSSSTGTHRHRRHREQAEDLRTHLHQALNFVFSPTEGKMSTNHWEQGQWKNWPSEHICFQSSENLISTCGLLRLFFFLSVLDVSGWVVSDSASPVCQWAPLPRQTVQMWRLLN